MTWTEAVSLEDERFHPRTDDPWWNESAFLTFQIPERRLTGILYFYFRPNQGTAMGGPFFWDDTGDDISNCLFWGWDWHMPIPAGAEMFDFRLANGFASETIVPQEAYCQRYEGPGCEFELTFVASREPYYMKKTPEGVNPGMGDWIKDVAGSQTTGHYEQYGRMSGTLVLDGEEIEVVDAAALKDRSWGPREILARHDLRRTGYSGAMASDESAFHVFAVSERPYEQDPIIGASDRVTSGFYVRDGVLGEIRGGTRRCLERGEDGRPLREVIEASDHLGRTLHAEAEITNWLKWPGCYGTYMAFVCQELWSFDGHTDAPGELQDYMHSRQYRRLMRSAVLEGGAGRKD